MSTTKVVLPVSGMLTNCGSDVVEVSAVVCATRAPRCKDEFATKRCTLSMEVVTDDDPRGKNMLVRR